MSQLNPLSTSILGSAQAQRHLEIDKDRQMLRANVLARNVAAEDERMEHEVESSDVVVEISDQQHREQGSGGPPSKRRQPPQTTDEEKGLDVTA